MSITRFLDTPVSVQTVFRNDTVGEVPYVLNQAFNSNILEDQSQYEVGITRAKIPVGALDTFYFQDKSKYWIAYRDCPLAQGNEFYKNYMPNDIDDIDPNTNYGVVKYRSQNDFISILNNVSYKCYRDMLAGLGNGYVNETQSFLMRFDSVAGRYTGGILDINMAVSAANTLVTKKVKHMEIHIKSMDFYTDSWNYASPHIGTVPDGNFILYLKNNATPAVSVNIFNGSFAELKNPKFAPKKIILSDAGFISGSFFDPKNFNKSNVCVQPMAESFTKIVGSSISHTPVNWTMNFLSDTLNVYGAIDFDLVLYCARDGYNDSPFAYPSSSISFSYNSDNKLTMLYDECYTEKGIKLYMSPELKTLLNFGNNYHTYDPTYGGYMFNYPKLYNHNPFQVAEIVQLKSTYFQICNISRIILSSKSIYVRGDVGISNSNTIFKDTLYDFSISTGSELETLEFNQSDFPWRTYALNSTSNLRNIIVDIEIEYMDGSIKPLYIATGEECCLRITFFKKSV